jgi:hypothetical protein
MKHSEVFMHAYANGKKSIEGIPAILSGLPSLMQVHDGYHQIIQWPFVLNFANDKVTALFHLEQDSLMKINQIENPLYVNKRDILTIKAKAIIQTFNGHIIHNTAH